MKHASVATKLALAIGGVLLLAAVIQVALLKWALDHVGDFVRAHGVPIGPGTEVAQHFRPRLLPVLAAPILAGSIAAGLLNSLMIRRRTRRLVSAFADVARGKLDVRLPDAPERDLAPVVDGFNHMSAALQEARRTLEHADLQRRRLFADLAHELATPTSSILGIADAFARPELLPTEADRARLAATLEHEAARLARLVSDVRDLASLDDPDVRIEREPQDLAALVRSTVARFRDVSGRDVALEVEAAHADVDASRIEQVLLNLLRNADRYTPPGGPITVRVAADGSIEVEDGGPGVPDDVLGKLGERLFRVDPSRDRRTGGHGLGLSIVRAIVARHEGSITFARSKLGGLAVSVRIPLCSPG